MYSPWAVAVDTTSNPPAIFVSDTFNNRVLGWRNASQFANGAKADLILGQLDDQSTERLGPGTARTLGFSTPGALAIDSKGSLYVVDTGNNRILRFPKPFASTDEIKVPDFVIGQPNFSSGTANSGGISETTVSLASSSNLATSGIAFDRDGNLWFSDSLNHRVLRYPRAVLDAGRNGPAADLVLGQPDFRTNNPPSSQAQERLNKTVLSSPSGMTVDNEGRLYVADSLSRVVVFTPPFFNAKAAARVVGVWLQPANQPFTTPEYVLGNPEGVLMMGNNLVVVDTGQNRLLRYDPFTDWPAETEAIPSPPAKSVLGQQDFNGIRANRGLPEATESTVAGPVGAVAVGNELYVTDSGNSRVLVFQGFGPTAAATRVLGQTAFNFTAPNIVEGRELFLFSGFSSQTNLSDGGGIAIDNRSTPPRLYIADTYNNRILGYRDARRVRPNDPADIVIGQSDLTRVLINAPQNNVEVPTDSGLFRPTGLIVDTNGDLFVADSGNARVLRFPSPFEQTIAPGARHRANLVLGQRDANSRVTDASRVNMAYPFGLALSVERHLVVSDAAHNRVLFFRRPTGGDFTSGMAAEKVVGQPDFFTISRVTAANRMFSPRHVALDTDDRLYVADSGNGRVLIFDRITTAANDPPVAFNLPSLTGAQGIWVSPQTGEIWVASTRANRAVRYPRFERLALGIRTDYEIGSPTPLALAQDSSGNLYVAEATNRVSIFFNGLRTQIAGNYAERPLSPGAIGIVYPRGTSTRFSNDIQTFDSLPNPVPLPKELADIQVLLDDRALPLYFVSPGQINYLVPYDVGASGTAELQVVRKSTNEILAAGTVGLAQVSPALFVQGSAEQGPVAALNQDGSVNTPANPVARGQYISLFATGMGSVGAAPAEGTPPPGPAPATEFLRVLINTEFVKDEDIQYFGLAPSLVGVYQINVKVPDSAAPGSAVDVVVQVRSTNSNVGAGGKLLKTTISVKP